MFGRRDSFDGSPRPEYGRQKVGSVRCFSQLVLYYTLEQRNPVGQSQGDLSCEFCRCAVIGEKLDDFVGSVKHRSGRSHVFALIFL